MSSDALFVTELSEDQFPPPGKYVAASTTQAYGMLTAMVAAGDATLLGERWEKGGPSGSTKYVAVQVGAARRMGRNGYLLSVHDGYHANARKIQVKAGKRFFSNALKDYGHNWPEKWWREAIQNSVDAGARNVQCVIKTQDDGNVLVSVIDDGKGMDPYTVEHKFLVLGETTKEGEAGAAGGFGKAKELLILPWLGWEVQSHETVARGVGDEGEIETASEYLNGTRLSVLMPSGQHTSASDAMAFLLKCNLPRVKFTVDGEVVQAKLGVRQEILNIDDKVAVYYDEKNTNYPSYILVRTKGLFMFEAYASSKPPGAIMIELLRPSIELLTANRDGFADWELRRQVADFTQRLAVEKKEAVRAKEKKIRKKFRGKGGFKAAPAERVKAAMLERLGPIEAEGKKLRGGDRELSEEQTDALIDILSHAQAGTLGAFSEGPVPIVPRAGEYGGGTNEPGEYTEYGAPGPKTKWEPVAEGAEYEEGAEYRLGLSETATGTLLTITPEIAEQMLKNLAVSGASHVENIVKQLAWEPDFYLINETANWNIPKKFYPESMTADVRKLARFWAEMCRFVLVCVNSAAEFGVGFIFDRHVVAQYVQEEDEHWLMLNPFDDGDPQSGKLKKLDDANMADVYASALHEVTHMADRTSDHDVDFAIALTKNIGLMFGKEKQARAIKSLVLAAEKEVTAKIKATRGPAPPRRAPKERRRDYVDIRTSAPPGGRHDGESADAWERPSSKWTVIWVGNPVGGADVFELGYAYGPAGPDTVEVVRLPFERGGLIDQLGLNDNDVRWVNDSTLLGSSMFEMEASSELMGHRIDALKWILAAMELSAQDVARRAGVPVYQISMNEWDDRWLIRR